MFQFGGLGALFGGAKPTKAPRGDGSALYFLLNKTVLGQLPPKTNVTRTLPPKASGLWSRSCF